MLRDYGRGVEVPRKSLVNQRNESAPRLRWNKPRDRGVKSSMEAPHAAARRPPRRSVDRVPGIRQEFTMKVSRILSAVFVLLALACGSLAHAADTDNAASSSSGNSNSSGGGY
jgi:hypothetical protein